MTPIGLFMLRLDHALIKDMLSCPFLLESHSHVEIGKKIARAKAQTFRFLLVFTEFQLRSSVGKGWNNALQSVLEKFVDNDMQRILADYELTEKGFKLLDGAIGRSRSHIAQGLLDLDLVDVNPSDDSFPPLHFAIERRMDDIAFALVTKGADLLTKDKLGQNALHMAAHHHSTILEPLIDILEGLLENRRCNRTTKQILELQTDNGFDVIGLLLVEGSQAELPLVERLRRRFGLDLDATFVGPLKDRTTLTGVLIAISNLSGLVPLTQIKYLLDLDPPPRFLCGENGTTLLNLAVIGQMNCMYVSTVQFKLIDQSRSNVYGPCGSSDM